MKKFLLFLIILVSCDHQPQSSKVDTKPKPLRLDHLQDVAGILKKELLSNLQQQMQKSPIEALNFCHINANDIVSQVIPDLTKKIEQQTGLKGVIIAGRSSLQTRNPDNTPKDWMTPYLKQWSQTKLNNPAAPVIVRHTDEAVSYAEPIYTMPMCLTCHGQQIDKQLQKEITQRYPKDQALNYSAGDFRGMLWVQWKRRHDP